jgi:hypothetical protein
MKHVSVVLVAMTIVLSLTPRGVIAKNAYIGIYAIVDQVTFEPNERSPQFIRISGVFVVPTQFSSGDYHYPKKGYLYFRVPPEKEEAIRKDWEQLKGFAGTGEVVAFGEYWVPNPSDPQGNPHHSLQVTIHTSDDLSSPDDYPLYRDPVGVRRASEMTCDADHDPKCYKIMTQLRAAWHH